MTRISRVVYFASAWIFLFGVTIQVFLAGMVVVAAQINWNYHASFGFFWGIPLLLMLATAYLGRLPRSMKWMTWILLGIYVIQVEVIVFLRQSVPIISALHPVLALADFALGLRLARKLDLETS